MNTVGARDFSPKTIHESAEAKSKFQILGANERVGAIAFAALVGVTTFFGLILTGVPALIAAPVSLYVGLTLLACIASNLLKPLKLSEKEQAAIAVLDQKLAEAKKFIDILSKTASETIDRLNEKIVKKEGEMLETDDEEELALENPWKNDLQNEIEKYKRDIEAAKKELLKDQQDYKFMASKAFKNLLASIPKEKQAAVLRPYQENYSLAICDAIGNG